MWREVYGTFIGVLPLIIVVAAGALSIIRDNDRHELQISQLRETDTRHEQQLAQLKTDNDKTRNEILTQLGLVVSKIESLQIQVAKQQGR